MRLHGTLPYYRQGPTTFFLKYPYIPVKAEEEQEEGKEDGEGGGRAVYTHGHRTTRLYIFN